MDDRVCVVTGASRGIGMAISSRLVAEGARVLMVARDEERLRRSPRTSAPSGWRPT